MFGWLRTASVHFVTAEASVSDILVRWARLRQPLYFRKVESPALAADWVLTPEG